MRIDPQCLVLNVSVNGILYGCHFLLPQKLNLGTMYLEARSLLNEYTIMEIIFWIGKILFGGFFVWNGIEHFTNIKGLTGYAKHKKIPAAREMVYLSGVLLLLGGFSIIFEQMVVLGILILIVFMISVTFSAHRFWQAKEPMEKMNEKVTFMKNMAIIGALIMLLMMSIIG